MRVEEIFRRARFQSVTIMRRIINPGDLVVFAHLLILRNWLERARINFVIDVGGNVGQFASALRYIGYRGDILSFEPIPESFSALSRRMHLDKRWSGRQIAIGDSTAETILNVMNNTVYSSFLSRLTHNKDSSDTIREKLRVQVKTLASIVDEMDLAIRLPRTLLKIDTQGHEMAVLRGLGSHIEQLKLVQCEISSIPLYREMSFMTEIIDFLHHHDFKSVSFAPVNGDSIRPMEFDYLSVNGREPI